MVFCGVQTFEVCIWTSGYAPDGSMELLMKELFFGKFV